MESQATRWGSVVITNEAAPAQGKKFDDGKDPWHLLPYDALQEVVRVLKHGAHLYDERNWEKGINYSRIFGAIQRHGVAWWQYREQVDGGPKGSGLHPLAHLACEALFALAFELRKQREFDDRPTVYGDAP